MAEGLDGYKLVRVFFSLMVTGGLREGDGRRDIFLIVEVRERWQRTRRQDRGKGKDGVSRGRGTQTSVSFCGGFTGRRDVEFTIWQGFHTFCYAVVINGGRGAVAVREPICLGGRVDGNGTVDGGAIIVDRGAGAFFGSDREVGWGDGVRILQGRGDGETESLWGKGRSGGDSGG